MKRLVEQGLGIGGFVLLVGCGQTAPDEHLGHEGEQLTAPTQVSSFALLSSGHITLGDRTVLSGGHVGVSPGTGDSVTEGSQAIVALSKSTLGQRVVLKDHAQAGDLFTNSVALGAGATYTSLSPFTAPPAQPPIVAFTAGTTPLAVNSPLTLPAGNFGQVTVNSTLTLSGGTYQFQNLTFGTNAVLQASAASTVRVAGKVSGATANFVHIGPTGTQPAANFRLVVAGLTDTNGGVALGTDAKVTAIVVSRASFSAADRFVGKGALAAKNITIGNDASMTFQTGFDCNADTACDDGNPCTADACIDAKCVHSNATNGTSCTDDGNACTNDVCTNGACSHGAVSDGTPCTSDNNPCTNDQCSGGVCAHPPLADGSACPDDGHACTADTCVGGSCSHALAGPVCAGPPVSTVSNPSAPPTLPAPPTQPGCYAGTLGGWVQVQCADPADVALEFGHPDVDLGIASVAGGSSSAVPLVFGQVETVFTTTPMVTPMGMPTPIQEQDVFDPVRNDNSSCGPGGPASGFEYNDNQWSVQNNTNFFPCDLNGPDPSGTFECGVQFTIQTDGGRGTTAVCITNANAGVSACDPNVADHTYAETCVGGPDNAMDSTLIKSRVGPLVASDFANIAGLTFEGPSGPMIALITQFSWAAPNTPEANTVNEIPGLYAVVTEDKYGLTNQWTTVTGNVLGFGSTSMASFTNAGVVSRILASSCPGDTSAGGPICPSQAALEPNAVSADNVLTAEQNNLMLVPNTGAIGYLNQDLAVAEFVSSDDGTCSAGLDNRLYLKDNDGDNGGVPSNSGGLPFWESPDIFVLPHTTTPTPPGVNDVSADWSVTPDQTYDIYLRVNNDGCTSISGLQALLYIADPDVGLPSWQAITTNESYVPDPTNATVAPFSRQIIGPFTWTPDPGSSGHKCLLAAIGTAAESGPPAPLPLAYNSGQVAQRNLEFSGSGCQYNITNPAAEAVVLQLGVSASSPVPATITLQFTDDSALSNLQTWAADWRTQASSSFAVTTSTDAAGFAAVTLTLTNSNQVAPAAVLLSGGDSPSLEVTISPQLGTVPTVSVSATLTSIEGDIVSTNGGSCTFSSTGNPH